ncbi:MAG: undecaprenyl-diphosphatase BcrC [Candidatus Parcubacteria bacterium]|jgi:undecaprenyl-diphosphatase
MMHAFDLKIFYSLYNLSGHAAWSDWLIICVAEYIPYGIIMAVVCGAFFAWRSKRNKQALGYSLALFSGIVARGLAGVIRFFYHHARPFVTLHLTSLFPENSYSFPSGHAIFYFALAAGVYQVNKKFGRVLYVLAFFIGLARIAAGVHYPFDILAGAVFGILIAKVIFWLHKRYWK